MGDLTPAHIMMLFAAFGLFVPVLTAVAMFLLQRLFGGGDDIRNKVHALEVAQVSQYATRADIDSFRSEVRGQMSSLRADMNRVLAHFSPNASFPE